MSRGPVLTDEMWARIEPLLPAVRPMGPPLRPHRPVVEGALYRLRTRIPWRDLPAEFRAGNGSPDGIPGGRATGPWDAVLDALLVEADAAGKIGLATSVDSTIARVHQHGGSAARSSEKPA